MNAELIRKAREAGYRVHWLLTNEITRSCAQAISAKQLSMCPPLAVLRKGL